MERILLAFSLIFCGALGSPINHKRQYVYQSCPSPCVDPCPSYCQPSYGAYPQSPGETLCQMRSRMEEPEFNKPVCNYDGSFREYQCEPYSRFKCWCVYDNGMMIPGSALDFKGDPAQEFPKLKCKEKKAKAPKAPKPPPLPAPFTDKRIGWHLAYRDAQRVACPFPCYYPSCPCQPGQQFYFPSSYAPPVPSCPTPCPAPCPAYCPQSPVLLPAPPPPLPSCPTPCPAPCPAYCPQSPVLPPPPPPPLPSCPTPCPAPCPAYCPQSPVLPPVATPCTTPICDEQQEDQTMTTGNPEMQEGTAAAEGPQSDVHQYDQQSASLGTPAQRHAIKETKTDKEDAPSEDEDEEPVEDAVVASGAGENNVDDDEAEDEDDTSGSGN